MYTGSLFLKPVSCLAGVQRTRDALQHFHDQRAGHVRWHPGKYMHYIYGIYFNPSHISLPPSTFPQIGVGLWIR
jgi:hypothetical protein